MPRGYVVCRYCDVPSLDYRWLLDEYGNPFGCPTCEECVSAALVITAPEALVCVREVIREKEQELKRLRHEEEGIQEIILRLFEEREINSIRVNDKVTVYLKRDVQLRPQADRETCVQALESAGLHEFVRKCLCKDATLARYIAQHKPDLSGAFSVAEYFRACVRSK